MLCNLFLSIPLFHSSVPLLDGIVTFCQIILSCNLCILWEFRYVALYYFCGQNIMTALHGCSLDSQQFPDQILHVTYLFPVSLLFLSYPLQIRSRAIEKPYCVDETWGIVMALGHLSLDIAHPRGEMSGRCPRTCIKMNILQINPTFCSLNLCCGTELMVIMVICQMYIAWTTASSTFSWDWPTFKVT